jgi:fatty-acid desaturase
LVTWGEGWHNNHHAYRVSARHGLKWYEIDLNWYGIWVMKKLGLAGQVHCAKVLSQQREKDISPAESRSEFVSA